MEEISSFCHRAGLVVRCVDTTTGQSVIPVYGEVKLEGDTVPIQVKTDGIVVLQPWGHSTGTVELCLSHYLPVTCQYGGETPGKVETVPLVPAPDHPAYDTFWKLEGNRKGLCAISGVPLYGGLCMVRAYDETRKCVKLVNPHKLWLDQVWYGAIDQEKQNFCPIVVGRMPDVHTVQLNDKPKGQLKPNMTVARQVFGTVDTQGHYRFLVRQGNRGSQWLLCCEFHTKVMFRVVDLSTQQKIPWR